MAVYCNIGATASGFLIIYGLGQIDYYHAVGAAEQKQFRGEDLRSPVGLLAHYHGRRLHWILFVWHCGSIHLIRVIVPDADQDVSRDMLLFYGDNLPLSSPHSCLWLNSSTNLLVIDRSNSHIPCRVYDRNQLTTFFLCMATPPL